jgi:hypothetical protein
MSGMPQAHLVQEVDGRLSEHFDEALGKGGPAHGGQMGETVEGVRRGRTLKNSRDGAGEPAILQHCKKRRVDAVVNEVLAQQQNEALLHKSLGQGSGTDAWVR